MSDAGSGYGPVAVGRRGVSERTTTTILRQRHVAVGLAGTIVSSALVGPPAGKRWLIQSVVAESQFAANPGGNDSGNTSGEILDAGGAVYILAGASNDNKDANQSVHYGHNAPDVTLEEGDAVRVTVDATFSTVDINGIFTFWGFEFDALV